MMNQTTYSRLEAGLNYILNEKFKKIFLISGKNSFKDSGARDRLKNILFKNITHFYDFSPNPKIEDVTKGIKVFNSANPELILAIGGGTTLDMAKLIKGLANSKNPKYDTSTNRINPKTTKIIAVPTTAGSGSESTPFAVVYINGTKYSLENESLLPNGIILDHTLTQSLTPKQTAISGMDAFSQAIESYWSVNSTDESKRYAKQSILLILDNLKEAVNNPNKNNRTKMLLAANLAGKAIAISKTTACHSISYPITSRFNVPHGHAVALTLGEVFEYNSQVQEEDYVDKRGPEYVRKTMSELMSSLKVSSPQEAKEKIKKLMQDIDLETKLSVLGIDIGIVIKEGFNIERMKNNPRRINEESLRRLLKNIK